MSAVLAWLPALAWASVIWLLGGEGFSEPTTSRILGPLLAWLLPTLTDEARDGWLWSIRSLAHPIVYGILALLSLRGVRSTLAGSAKRQLGYALAPTIALALADEARQSLSTVRTGSLGDAGLDILGAACALGALAWIEGRLGSRRLGRSDRHG